MNFKFLVISIFHKNTNLNVLAYKNIIVPVLEEAFDVREAENLFKNTLEDYFNKRFLDLRSMVLNDEEIEELNYIFEKITNHYPIQYIFNKSYFYDLEFYVDENVLIPRPETEELVHWILTSHTASNVSLLDVGTGSGCIPITIKHKQPTWHATAIDVSDKALEVALKNAKQHHANIHLLNIDILDADSVQKSLNQYDIIVSNPPYIPYCEQSKMSISTVLHEPDIALFVQDETPLLFYERIAIVATQHLKANGMLYFELNEFNAVEVQYLLEKIGFPEYRKPFAAET